MKTKSDVEIEVVGQISLNGKNYFICNLPNPLYVKEIILYKYILLPISDFNIDNGIEWADVQDPSKHDNINNI